MIEFGCDYAQGACPEIMERLLVTNMEQTPGYGEDMYCRRAEELIKKECESPDASVHFLTGGTQANLTVISSLLRPHQGVIAAESGHIAVHETGAIEACGHKVLTVPSKNGKISAADVKEMYDNHVQDKTCEHMVQPKLVYISQPTEYGTIYGKAQLKAMYEICNECGFLLYIDGARLAYGLTAASNTLSLPQIAKLCDVFYIGGTKCGALFGEAVVITNPLLQQDFRYIIKQKGGLFAKGRLLGVQFETLFTDGLYYRLGSVGNKMAARLREGFEEHGISMYMDCDTNQQFPMIKDALLSRIQQKYSYLFIGKWQEGESIVRFCTSWGTREEEVEEFLKDLNHLVSQ